MGEQTWMKDLEFREDDHVYLLGGVEIPSVTRLMEPLSRHEYERVSEWTLRKAAERGTAVHNAIENYIKFGLDDTDPEYKGYMDSFHEWWAMSDPEVIGSEMRVYHKTLRYAGTIDLVAKIDGKVTLIDYKTTSRLMDKNLRVQLEAYAQALKSHGIEVERKMALHLKSEGWRAPEYDRMDPEALRVFTSLKCLYDYMRR